MKLSVLLLLPTCLLSFVLADSYTEHLHLLPLPAGNILATFNFTSATPLSAYQSQFFNLFPRSLAQILQHSHTSEAHLRFALGRWDDENWGARPRDGRREGGTGVELWAWVDGEGLEVEERWGSLVNSLSGLFCASLNFIDSTQTIRPVLSFTPEGTHDGRSELLHGKLPHEVVCTENLTPFLKLLPCKGKAGISSLLDGHKVFDANWQTMSIDVRAVCKDDGECFMEVQQTVDMVLDIERSMRPREDPVPRPRPIEEIACDESKSYNGHDTCYPKGLDGDMGWSLERIFGQAVKDSCFPLDAAERQWDVSLEVPEHRVASIPSDTASHRSGNITYYRIPSEQDWDLTLPPHPTSLQSHLTPPPLYASRQMTGHGQAYGGMQTVLRNPHPYPQRIVYLESLPWFLRPYTHTLQVAGAGVERMYYTPAMDRQRGTHLELLLTIPASSTVELTYEFEKAVLRYTEYPPDANRGFDVAPAVIRVLAMEDEGGQGKYLRTTSLLLPLPTPDFSMPYNVIILTSTVIALGFGSIFNLLVRRFVLVEEVPESPLSVRLKGLVGSARAMLRNKLQSTRAKSDTGESAIELTKKNSVAEKDRNPNRAETTKDR